MRMYTARNMLADIALELIKYLPTVPVIRVLGRHRGVGSEIKLNKTYVGRYQIFIHTNSRRDRTPWVVGVFVR